jgi:hypothetical protein
MALSSDQRKNFRFLLLMIILLTIPCYCLGIVVLRLADQVEQIERYPQDTPPPLQESTFTPVAIVPTETRTVNDFTPTTDVTATMTSTVTLTKTFFLTPTRTATLTPTVTLTPTNTPTHTQTVTPSPTQVPTQTNTPIPTGTETPVPTEAETSIYEGHPPFLPDGRV